MHSPQRHRGHGEKTFLFVPRIARDKQKASVSNKLPWPTRREFMENRYLPPARQKPLRRGEGPILHENISLSVLRVSNEPPSSWGEWAVKIVLNVNYFLLLVIRGGTCRSKTKPLWIRRAIRFVRIGPLSFELLEGKLVDIRNEGKTQTPVI